MMFGVYLVARLRLSLDWPTPFYELFPENKAKMERYQKISKWLDRRIKVYLKENVE